MKTIGNIICFHLKWKIWKNYIYTDIKVIMPYILVSLVQCEGNTDNHVG